jgi:hypothetical protein
MLTFQVESSSASSRIWTTPSIPVRYAGGNDGLLRLRLLEYRVGLLLGRILKLLTCFVELLTICKEIESAAELQVYAAPCIIVRGITKIAIRVEGLLYTKAVDTLLLTTAGMPALFLSRYPLALPYRYRFFLVVYFMSIETEEMEEQLAQTFCVVISVTSQLGYIVGET